MPPVEYRTSHLLAVSGGETMNRRLRLADLRSEPLQPSAGADIYSSPSLGKHAAVQHTCTGPTRFSLAH